MRKGLLLIGLVTGLLIGCFACDESATDMTRQLPEEGTETVIEDVNEAQIELMTLTPEPAETRAVEVEAVAAPQQPAGGAGGSGSIFYFH